MELHDDPPRKRTRAMPAPPRPPRKRRPPAEAGAGAPPPVPVGALRVFTDGACERNGRPDARAGIACVWPDAPRLSGAWPLLDGVTPTSNRAEMAALLRAARDADALDPPGADGPAGARTLVVHTDSMLLVNTLMRWLPAWRRRGWRKADGEPVLNADLCKQIAAACDRRAVVALHVRAHTGGADERSRLNELADELAGAACRQQREVRPAEGAGT